MLKVKNHHCYITRYLNQQPYNNFLEEPCRGHSFRSMYSSRYVFLEQLVPSSAIECGNKLFCTSFLVISSFIVRAPLGEQCGVGKIYVRLKKLCIDRRNAYHQWTHQILENKFGAKLYNTAFFHSSRFLVIHQVLRHAFGCQPFISNHSNKACWTEPYHIFHKHVDLFNGPFLFSSSNAWIFRTFFSVLKSLRTAGLRFVVYRSLIVFETRKSFVHVTLPHGKMC